MSEVNTCFAMVKWMGELPDVVPVLREQFIVCPPTDADGCTRDDTWDAMTPAAAYGDGFSEGAQVGRDEILRDPITMAQALRDAGYTVEGPGE